MSETTLRVYF